MSATTSVVLGCSRRFSTFSFRAASALKVNLLYPSIVNASPVAILTLLRGATALILKVPIPLIFTCLSSFKPAIIASNNASKNRLTSCSGRLAFCATNLRSSIHVILSFAIVYAFFS